MNFLDSLKTYGDKFQVIDSRSFEAEELACVTHAEVVASQYGMSCCFHMKSGGKKYLPLSRDSQACVGDTVDLTKAKVLTLAQDDVTISRLEI